jgi:hypothetical protein
MFHFSILGPRRAGARTMPRVFEIPVTTSIASERRGNEQNQ